MHDHLVWQLHDILILRISKCDYRVKINILIIWYKKTHKSKILMKWNIIHLLTFTILDGVLSVEFLMDFHIYEIFYQVQQTGYQLWVMYSFFLKLSFKHGDGICD